MNILVINGSPKGSKSITLQTVRFLEIKYPSDTFTVINVPAALKSIEKRMDDIIRQMRAAELILFSYPVYTFMAPAQLHQFIALLKERGCTFDGKYMTQLTTSKHFYDVTAHRYVEENCADLGFTVLPGLSADMEDLPEKTGQKQAADFWAHIHFLADGCPIPDIEKERYTVTLVTDATKQDTPLLRLIEAFQKSFPCKIRQINLNDVPIQGGCLGCLKCAATGKCVYTDGFDVFLREKVQSTDAIIYAFSIRDHSMGVRFKVFDDRQFCNGHRTVTMGHPIGYLISGDYAHEPNLATVITARAQVGGNFLAGIATDEGDIAAAADTLSRSLIFALEHTYQPPKNFYGQGGMRIFRDLIYQTQGLMRLDHKFFKEHGQYDFPQNHRGKILAMYLVGMLFKNPKLMKKMGSKIDEGMLMPYTKALEEARRGTDK